MKATITISKVQVTVDLSKPIDISIPLQDHSNNPLAWYIDRPKISPVRLDDWVGSVQEGAAVNFNNIYFNPHAHGTHTECVGHITKDFHSVNEALTTYFFLAQLISITPRAYNDDEVISMDQIKPLINQESIEALVIRTLPNKVSKKNKKYDHTNWPYLEEAAANYLKEIGIKHLLIDLPSVDKEKDAGALLAHKAFWNYPKDLRLDATITEFIYVPNTVKDGQYILNLQTAPFVNDAAPSRPLLYKLL